jgi:uncharacterized protein (TIRG00374 family)
MSARRRSISFIVAALVAGVLLYYSLRGIAWREVARIIAGADPGPLILACGLGSVSLFLRAVRWRILLNAQGDVRVPAAFWATAAGYFGNNFLPARAGEIVRAFMVGSRSTLDNAYVLATVLADRVADTIALLAISALILLTMTAPPGWMASAARPLAVIGLAGAAAIAILPFLGSVGRRLIARAPLPHTLRPRVTTMMEQALEGVRAFHHPGRLSGFLALTIVIWCLDAFATVIAGGALGLGITLPIAFLLIAGLGLGSSLPSTPGYVGIYQFVAVTVLTPFGFSRSDAIAFILLAQALNYVVMGVWGAIGLARYRDARRSITSAAAAQRSSVATAESEIQSPAKKRGGS